MVRRFFQACIKLGWGRAALAVLICLLCLSDVIWIRQNVAPPRMFDDAAYLIESVDLYDTLRELGLRRFLSACARPSRGGHPPMMKILPVPVYLVIGPGTNAALYGYTLLIVVFCVYLFLLTDALVDNEKTAVLAVAITCLFPLTFGMWRNVMAEFGISVATVAALYHLLKSSGFRQRKHVVLLGFFLGWGLLWKVSFPLFVAAPLAYVLFSGARPPLRNLVLLAGAVVLTAGPFYWKSGRVVIDWLRFSTSGDNYNEHWSLGPVYSLDTLAWYWLSIINWGISFYFFVLLAVVAALHVSLRRRWPVPRVLCFLAGWFLLPLGVLSFQELKEIRHLLPALPALGVLGAVLLAGFVGGRRRAAVLVLLGLYPAYQFIALSFDVWWAPRPDIRWGPFLVSIRGIELASLQWMPTYAFPANPTNWPVRQTVDVIAARTSSDRLHPSRALVAGTNPYFNGLVLQYQARLSRAPIYFHGLYSRAISDSDFVVTLPEGNGRYGPLDDREPCLQALLRDARLPFVEVDAIPFPDHGLVRVYQRIASVTDQLPEAALACGLE